MPTPRKYQTPEQRREARTLAQRQRRQRPFALDAEQAIAALDAVAAVGVTRFEAEQRLNSTDLKLLTTFADRLRHAFIAEMLVKYAPRSFVAA